jgi:3-deoxy-D-manno-octulosonic-acid transferase
MFTLYSIFIRIYYSIIFVISFFNKKAKDWIVGRNNQLSLIEDKVSAWQNNPIIWIHAASYGEFEMSRPIINAIQDKNVNTRFVVSFYSPSGYNHISLDENYFLKIYLPLDLRANHLALISVIKPKAVIFIKYEFWFNFLRVLKSAEVPYYFTGLHLNEDSYLLKPYFLTFKKQLLNASKIFCHNPLSLDILTNNGFKNLALFGDSRIEQVLKNKNNTSHIIKFNNNNKTIAFGSITEFETPYVIKFCNQNKSYNYIIATHDVSEKNLGNLISKLEQDIQLYSNIKDSTSKSKIILVDTYGDLRYLYKNADLAYIGAGFEKGPHNVLEPLVYGIPVCIGPNIKKFPMSQYLEQKELLWVINQIKNMNEMINFLNDLNKNDFALKSQQFFNENRTNIKEMVSQLNLTNS